MDLKPSHPDESDLHHQLRDALNKRLTSTDFFVWISVTPTGAGKQFADLESLVNAIEAWLATQDPDAPQGADDLPERNFSDASADVSISALPKKPEARSYRSEQIVGNPEPILVGWGS